MPEGYISLQAALHSFVEAEATQSQEHIRGLHSHLSWRLVVEGGFDPATILPRPPLRVEGSGRLPKLVHDSSVESRREQTVLGGVKTKDVDVVVAMRETGPVLAISVKGTLGAFRNLTNRMEEAAGDCTNIHMAYPALVYAFLHVIRANRVEDAKSNNDVAIRANGDVVETISRYHDAMSRLAGRRDLRNDISRYECICLALAAPGDGALVTSFPERDSPLWFDGFFDRIYACYDQRFVYPAAPLASVTGRREWHPESPVLQDWDDSTISPRTGVP